MEEGVGKRLTVAAPRKAMMGMTVCVIVMTRERVAQLGVGRESQAR